MVTWARSPSRMLLLGLSTMQKGPGENPAFWWSTANFVAPFSGAAGTGQKCLITGLFEIGARIRDDMKIIFTIS